MKPRPSICTLLVCCSVLWVLSCSSLRVRAHPSPPPPSSSPTICDARLEIPSVFPSSFEGSGDVNNRSLSPWTWRTSMVKNRIPTIYEAECSSSFCVSPKSGRIDGHNLNSVPIYQDILVLQRQGSGRCYKAMYQRVAVGCTCVWAKTNQQ
ncbi:interleukin 17a/f2 [Xyrichtys novacula]|uniref:Interleukin 17a/f2 n=1 Tax=Xyrichtys novacula TaxID=13765 RepID=A0AAV1EMK4_XYRNO|nr:interleukin 17a/f2 [Xyrichtys novacula]